MKNPYELLWLDGPGDNSEITQRDIRSAFYLRAREHHPDTGGDPAKYAEVCTAYKILNDPRKRRIFDRTGDGNLALNWTASIEETLSKILTSILDAAAKESAFANSLGDIVETIRVSLEAGRTALNRRVVDAQDDLARTARISERLVFLSGSDRRNVMSDTLAQRRAMLEQRVESDLLSLEATAEAIGYLESYIDADFKS